MLRVGVGLLLLSVLTSACSSGYEPARSPRIATVILGGAPTWVKGGNRYGTPVFGVGLVDAVQGNPRAQQQARIGRNLAIGGFVFDMTGFGSELAGVVVATQGASQGHQSRDLPLAAGLMLGGIGALIVGTALVFSAQPHFYDAVNIYNDGVDAPAQ